MKYDKSVWALQALRLFAVVACAFGTYRAAAIDSPLAMLPAILAVPQLLFFIMDIKKMRKS